MTFYPKILGGKCKRSNYIVGRWILLRRSAVHKKQDYCLHSLVVIALCWSPLLFLYYSNKAQFREHPTVCQPLVSDSLLLKLT